jgi:citronellol/citronellal dehydrogenase
MKGRVCVVTGASRGIGRECAITFARAGCAAVVVAAKSVEEDARLPGTIYTVADEVSAINGCVGFPFQLDVTDVDAVTRMVEAVVSKFGRIDVLVCNAGALWWKDVVDTPMKRYDLINAVNSRGTFACTRAVLPHMLKQGWGRIITMSPPISLSMLKGKVAYSISKFGMSFLAMGLAEEVAGTGVTSNALWPATAVESFATKNFKMGDESVWRKASIIADATREICLSDVTGQTLIDEDFLRTRGWTDFAQYRCNPDVEPPRIDDFRDFQASKPGDALNTEAYRSKF